MKNIEKIKFICGIILIIFAILGGLIFYLESFKVAKSLLNYGKLSAIFEGGWLNESGGGASNVPIFLGLCGLSGAYLLGSIKPIKTEKKVNSTEE
jgi:hypothetical protein